MKNNVIVLSVPFVHHTELQNFLITSRTYTLNVIWNYGSSVANTGQKRRNIAIFTKFSHFGGLLCPSPLPIWAKFGKRE